MTATSLCFRQVGIESSLIRLIGRGLDTEHRLLVPPWLMHAPLAFAAYRAMQMGAAFMATAHNVKMWPGAMSDDVCEEGGVGGVDVKDAIETASWELAVCLVRVAVGAHLEFVATRAWKRVCRLEVRARLAQDACAVAVWTSVHVEHARRIVEGGALWSEPSLASVPSQYRECSLDHVIDERVVCGSSCRGTTAMHQLLTRCTNPASRGWTSTLHSVLAEEPSVVEVLRSATVVCLTGLHLLVEPPDRPHWRKRAAIMWRMQADVNSTELAIIFSNRPMITKEVVRRLVVTTLETSIALRHVVHHYGSMVGSVGMPPRAIPCQSVCRVMSTFCVAGELFGEDIVTPDASDALDRSLCGAFDEDPRVMQWLSKVIVHHPPSSALTEASVHHFTGFRHAFAPFWAFAMQRGLRPQRLDPTQYDAIHGLNPATALVASMNYDEALRIQRIVLQTPSLGVRTVADMWSHLSTLGCSVAARDSSDETTVDSILRRGSSNDAATLLLVARLMWLTEQLLVVDLCTPVRRVHAIAVLKRHGRVPDPLAMNAMNDDELVCMLDTLPAHATKLCVCTECKRVTNAAPTETIPTATRVFTEMGVSSVMLSTHSCGECVDTPYKPPRVTLHCARRSSAALRSAIAAEEEAVSLQIDSIGNKGGWETSECDDILRSIEHDRATSTRMRRDSRRALEQRRKATQCGESPLVMIPLLGRAVRIYGVWYTLCAICGTVTKLRHADWIGVNGACLVCARRMRNVTMTSFEPVTLDNDLTRGRRCRFCAKSVPCDDNGSSFRCYASPHDTFGANKRLPPWLRCTWWCPAHQRRWLANALMDMSTPSILAHIVQKAHPMIVSEALGHSSQASLDAQSHTEQQLITVKPAKNKRKRTVATMKRKTKSSALDSARSHCSSL